jgi:hypothetical protein
LLHQRLIFEIAWFADGQKQIKRQSGYSTGFALHFTPRHKAVLVIIVVVVAAVAGGYYFLIPHVPAEFNLSVNPPFFHAAAGGGVQLLVHVSRVPGYVGEVDVALANPPAWISAKPIVINSTSVNGTLTVVLTNEAQKGTYQLGIIGTASGSSSQTTTIPMRVVGVNPISSTYGSALVYETTKVLGPSTLQDLVGFTNGTLEFSKSTPQLDGLNPGDVIVATPNSTKLAPHGFLQTVLNIRKQNGNVYVDTRIAALVEVFQELHFGHLPGNSTGSSGGVSASSISPSQENDVTSLCAGTLSCVSLFDFKVQPNHLPANLGGDVTLNAYIEAKAFLYAYGDISCCVNVDFGLLVLGHEEAYAGISGSAGSQLNWDEDNLAEIIPPITIPILPPFLWLDINLNLAGHAAGTLKSNVNANVDQYLNLVLGPTFDGGMPSSLQDLCHVKSSGFDFCTYSNFQPPTPKADISLPTGSDFTVDDIPRISFGPRLSADVDGVAGLAFELDAMVLLNSNFVSPENPSGIPWPCEPGWCPRWVLYFGLNAILSIWINLQVWSANFHITWVPAMIDWEIAHAPNYPPGTPSLNVIPCGSQSCPTTGTLDLSHPAFLDPNLLSHSWFALVNKYPNDIPEPEGESVTCLWMTKEFGQIATTPAPVSGTYSNLPVCEAPPISSLPVGQIIAGDVTSLTVTVVAEDAGGMKSPPSNPITMHIILPTPTLQIQIPIPGATVQSGQPFSGYGKATVPTVISSSNPNGLIDLCQTQSQNIAWFVGGNYEPDIVDVGEGGWVGAQSGGTGCNPSLTATNTGQTATQTTVYMVLLTTDPQTGNPYVVTDSKGNPVQAQPVTINVLPTPAPPPPGVTTLSVQIITPSEPGNAPPHTVTSNPTVQLQGSLTGGTAPYTVTWTGTWDGKTAIIAKGLKYNTLSYNWQVCTNGFPWFPYGPGTIIVHLNAVDSSNPQLHADDTSDIQIQFNCVVTGAFPPIFATGALVTLLTVIFTVTTERKTQFNYKQWFRIMARISASGM